MAWEIASMCDVCYLLDGDERLKPTMYCGKCDANICEQCQVDSWRRFRAMFKRKRQKFFRRIMFTTSLVFILSAIGFAQTPPPPSAFELPCPANTSPLPPNGWTLNPITNKYRAWVCVDPDGNVTVQGTTPSSLTPSLAIPNAVQMGPAGASNTDPGCPTTGGTVNPWAWVQKTDGTYYTLAGLDVTTQSPLVAPFGVITWCQPVFFNDTGIVPIFAKNNQISIYHQFGASYLGTGNTLDDRAIGMRTETLSSITGSNNARIMGIYGETGLKGTPTQFGSGPDVGAVGIRWTLDDSRTGGSLQGTPMVAIDGSYQDSASGGATNGSCGNDCAVGVRGVAQADISGGGGSNSYTGGYFAVDAAANGNNGIGNSLIVQMAQTARFALNRALVLGTCSVCNSSDIDIDQQNTLNNYWSGSHFLESTSPQITGGNGTLGIAASIATTGSISSSQFSAPTAPAVSQGGTAGSTSYSYAICPIDGNGGVACSPANSTITGNATLSVTNFNSIQIQVVNGVTAYNIYRTASSGTPSSTGLIGQLTFVLGAAPTDGNLFFQDTGLAGDSSSLPTINNTGSIASGSSIKTKAVAFATLAACSSAFEGLEQAVVDSTTNTWGMTITGSGSDHVLAYCDGTQWTVAAK